ncbi:lytic transglycosylase domain-containing protein [Lysobacter sp. A3-1-A15]|uniref:lytic transglycosylase domain-containing protein n=1 Tax=Novilysobacter viscosus TaxID=3098602 RepID=UPI002EDB9D9F
MRGRITLLGIACLLAAGPAVSGTIYRCEAADGTRSYVSKRVSGATCKSVSEYSTVTYKPPARAASGGATPVSLVSGSPASASAPAQSASMTNAAPTTPVSSGQARSRLVQGQVYSYIKDGVRHYSSARPKGVASASPVRTIKYSFFETCYACAAKPGVSFHNVRLNMAAYQDEISTAAREHGVDEAVVRAIIHAESAFNPNALSRVGAQGLMQLMPATARRFGVGNAFEPSQNIRGGVKYLAWLLKRFNGNLTLAAAGYNAGEGNVDKYKGVPPFDETQRYVQRVAILADRYRGAVVAR